MKTVLALGVLLGFLAVMGEAPTFKLQLVSATIGICLMVGCGNWLIQLLKREN